MGALRDGGVEVGDGLQGDAELGDEGLHQEGIGGDDALIGGQRRGALDGLDALVDDVGRAHVVGAEEALQGGAARELRGFEGRPAAEEVTKDRGIFVLKPLQDLREVVFEGTGEAVGEPHFVADQAAAVFDELREGAHGGALGVEGLELVAMREQEFELEFGIGGVVFGPAGGEGFAVPARVSGLTGKSTRKSYLRKAETMGPLLSSRQTATGWPLNRVRRVLTHASMASGWCSRTLKLPFLASQRLVSRHRVWHPPSRCQRRPQMLRGAYAVMCHLLRCARVVRRDMPACVLRRHYREPVARQTLSIR